MDDEIVISRTDNFIKITSTIAKSYDISIKTTGLEEMEKMMKPDESEIPVELKLPSERVYVRAQLVLDDNLKINERNFRFKKEQMDRNMKYAEERIKVLEDGSEMSNQWKKVLKKWGIVRNIANLHATELSDDEIMEIDEDFKEKMEELEKEVRKNSPLKMEPTPKYFKFISVRKELTEALESQKSLIEKINAQKKETIEAEEQLNRICKRQMKNRELKEEKEKQARFELQEKFLVVKSLVLQLYEAQNRIAKVFGMKEMFFPAVYDRPDGEEDLDSLFND